MRTLNGVFALIGVSVSLLLSDQIAYGQTEMRRGPGESEMLFNADVIAYAAGQPDKSSVDVYVQVPHDQVGFLKEGDQYIGRYDVSLSLYTPSKQLVNEQSWTIEVPAADFAHTTQSGLFTLSHRRLTVDPGNYQLTIQLRDQETRRTGLVRRSLLVTDFSKDSISLSDIMLVNRLSTDGGKRNVTPNISGTINSIADGFYVFFELYNKPALDSVDVSWKIYDSKKDVVVDNVKKEATPGHKSQIFLKIDSTGLHMGTYFLVVEATAQCDSAGTLDTIRGTTSRTFRVRAAGLPAAIVDLDKAVDQLIYIARGNELEYIRAATTEDEKRKRFLEFWAKRDPDPSTPQNELMEEYYARVAYANQNFGHYLEGWRTDMGMVYIRFGAPENIERHPFETDSKPYEIWYYYQLNRQFIFVDETGFGDYRLRYPTTDLWGRMR